MGKIYISIGGGCIREVLSTNKKDTVEIWDWDNIQTAFRDTSELEKEYNTLSKKLHHLE